MVLSFCKISLSVSFGGKLSRGINPSKEVCVCVFEAENMLSIMGISSIGGGLPLMDVDPSESCCVSLLLVTSISISTTVSTIGAFGKWGVESRVIKELFPGTCSTEEEV
ncbi:unnamed protein product [Rhizophagus irregularis]|uniref:Uncharacterized protein n=1 Tax=Rhizophagus irregularis TaxID=588596 RepID=A0A915YVH7_9GLOM|nr:unnamed protein product [Rhizophagus irregularis]